MAGQTYAELQKQIQKLQEQAEKVRATEIDAVISDIRDKIAEYDLTAKDLGFGGTYKPKKLKTDTPSPLAAKYQKGAETWSGKGRQPKWIKDLIAGGGDIEQYKVAH